MDIEALPIALPDGIDYDEFIVGTYLVSFPKQIDIPKLAPALAIEQSTGTWVAVRGETPEVRRQHVAKAIGVYEIPDHEWVIPADVQDRNYVIQVAFPVVNIESQIPMLLTAVVGNISMAGRLKLVDMRFPAKFVEGFGGPKFGIPGVRKLLGVKDRPLLNNMIKPCTGYPCEVGVELFRQAALGGADIIKDDELLADMSFNRVQERAKAYMEAEKQVYEETGEHTLYTVNVSDEIPKVFENTSAPSNWGSTRSWSTTWPLASRSCVPWRKTWRSMCPSSVTWTWRGPSTSHPIMASPPTSSWASCLVWRAPTSRYTLHRTGRLRSSGRSFRR